MDSGYFTLQSISKYRTELMGIAIIGVLIGHIIAFNQLDYPVIDSIAHGIHTAGFLFLSGYGVYYSLSKNGSSGQFYVRRFWRFYVPFLLIYLPFLLRTIFTGNFNIFAFLSRITTLTFWIDGNVDGMWYISVSLILYLLVPPIYHWFTRSPRTCVMKMIILIAMVIAINYILQFISPDYWDRVSIGLKHTHMFLWGMMVAYLTLNKDALQQKYIIASIILVTVLYLTLQIMGVTIPYLSPLINLLFYIVLFCILFAVLDGTKVSFINSLFRWFGKYTLELYLLHLLLYGFLMSPLFHLEHSYVIILAVIISIITCAPVHFIINKLTILLQNK